MKIIVHVTVERWYLGINKCRNRALIYTEKTRKDPRRPEKTRRDPKRHEKPHLFIPRRPKNTHLFIPRRPEKT